MLETERLILREMAQEDFPALCAILQDEDVMYAYEGAFSDDEARRWLEKQIRNYQEHGFGLWAVVLKDAGKMIGQCGLTLQDYNGRSVPEVGYLFQKAYWHCGYVSEAAVACREYAFHTLDVEEVYSIIRDTNIPSQNVAKRNGMTCVGRFVKHYRGVDMPHLVFSVKRVQKRRNDMKLGMVGGIGPESTVDYYQRIIRRYRETVDPDGYPQIVIDSIDMTAMLRLVSEGDWDGLADMLLASVDALHRAGAGLAFIASNTPHIVFGEVQKCSPIPLVSIVEAARGQAQRLGLKKLALLGTGFTMGSGYYAAEFDKAGIALVTPAKEERRYIEHKLFTEIENGVFRDDTREELMAIIRRMKQDDGVDGVILGCTELPLILTQESYDGLPFINTTQTHVERIMEAWRGMAG